MTKMVCEECKSKADLMAVWNGEVICFRCLAKNHPILASKVMEYLTWIGLIINSPLAVYIEGGEL